jgi:hypothetical protein
MAGIINTTARQFNVKAVANGRRVCVRLSPGFNVVDDAIWSVFVPKGKTAKDAKVDDYVARLQKEGKLRFGGEVDDLELEQKPDTKTKTSTAELPKKKKAEVED